MPSHYTLPDLSYDYGSLEPHVSGKIMELHHSKHHAAYVKGANESIEKLDEARDKADYTRLGALEKALSFHLSGHILHSIFWQNLAPKAEGRPSGELARAIDRDFGSFAKLRKQLTETAATIMGSGWSALVWEPIGRRLLTTQIYDHQSNLSQGGIPLFVIDAWEHAYYLQYQNRKTEFFDAIWNVVDWEDVARRFMSVRDVNIELADASKASTAVKRGARIRRQLSVTRLHRSHRRFRTMSEERPIWLDPKAPPEKPACTPSKIGVSER